MSVGTESIQRAATKAAETEETAKETVAEKISGAAAEETKISGTKAEDEMTQTSAEAAKITAPKKTTAKKTSATKKTSTVKKSVIPSLSPQVAENMRLSGQERYQVNDELPTYLL